MKVFALKKVVFCTVLVALGTEAANASTIYGLDKARQFKSSQHAPFTIQVGAFASEHNARQLKATLMNRIHSPIHIFHIKQRYTVVIGPLPTDSAVRAIAEKAGQVDQNGGRQASYASRTIPSHHETTDRHVALMPTSPSSPHNHHWFFGGDLGLLHAHIKDTMTVNNGSDFPAPENVDQYSLKRHEPVMLALQVGHRWDRQTHWIPSYTLGARYQHLFVKDVQGSITQYSLPEFNNYTYRWGVAANILSLYSKVGLVQYGRVMPYVDAGLGLSITQSQSYQETAYAGVTPRVSPGYQARDKEQLSYNVGFGVDVAVTSKITMSLGYDYQSFGRLESGNGISTWSGEHLGLGTFAASSAVLGVTYWMDNDQ